MILKLITIKEYCKLKNITDAAVRKKIKTNSIDKVILNDLTYVVIETNEVNELKTKLKLSNSKIREIKKELLLHTNQNELIEKLENKIEKLENKIDSVNEKKDKLYENMFSNYNTLLPLVK